jgi:hypothetical protein
MPAIDQHNPDLFFSQAQAEHDRTADCSLGVFLLVDLEPFVSECGEEFDGYLHVCSISNKF